MQRLWDYLFDEDDEEIEQDVRVLRVLQHQVRLRINYFEELNENEFVNRFRLSKQSVTMLLNRIHDQLEHVTNWYIYKTINI